MWLYANGEEIVPVIINDEGNIAIKTACFVEFLLSFDNQEEDFSISDCPLINKNAKCEGGKDLVFSPWHPSGLDLGVNHTTDYRHTQS